MKNVVFLRAVNVGGHQLKPKELADALGMTNIGAAGTYVTDLANPAPKIQKQIPYPTEIMVCPADEILALAEQKIDVPDGAKLYVSVLAKPAKASLPIAKPDGKPWEVRVEKLVGRYALSLWMRRDAKRLLYPNEVVEKHIGVATTRGWDTLLTICRVLSSSQGEVE